MVTAQTKMQVAGSVPRSTTSWNGGEILQVSIGQPDSMQSGLPSHLIAASVVADVYQAISPTLRPGDS